MNFVPELKTSALVIGYSLEALQCARSQGGLLLVNSELKPHVYEKREIFKEWTQLSFYLGMSGAHPLPSKIHSIRIDGHAANVTTEFYKLIKIEFEELYIFDMELVEGLPIEEEVQQYEVYDWFNITRGAKHPSCQILRPDSFLRKVVLYPSKRGAGASRGLRDCYTQSYMTPDELTTFECSETAARLGTTSILKKNGFKGPSRVDQGITSYSSLELVHHHRDIYKYKKTFLTNEELPTHIFCCNIHT